MAQTPPIFECHPVVFPQELSDHIIEYLFGNGEFESVKNCSLVCWAWLYTSRRHLYKKVALTSNNVSGFMSLIVGHPSNIPPYVAQMEFHHVESRILQHISRTGFLTNFASTLAHLHLCSVLFPSFLGVLDVICTFSCLQTVALDKVTWGESYHSSVKTLIQDKVLPTSVNYLRLRNGPLRQFLAWLTDHETVPMLQKFDVGPIEEDDTMASGKYLVHLGANVKHLAFSFGFGSNGHICALQALGHASKREWRRPDANSSVAERYKMLTGLDTCPNIGSLTGLHSLRIDTFIHNEDSVQSSALFWAPRLFSSIEPSELKEIILGVTLSRVGDLDKSNVNWEFFDVVFTSKPYRNLASLLFDVGGRVDLDGLAYLISSRLPRCAKKGSLRFLDSTVSRDRWSQ